MRKDMDVIQFESIVEIRELLEMIEKYINAYPKEKDNNTIKRFYDLLDVMEMEW